MRGLITNIAGWRDTEFRIHAAAGRFNCSWNNSSGRLWTFPVGTVLHSDGVTPISSSTAEQPDVDIPTGGGVVKLRCKGWGGDYRFNDKDTDIRLLLDLSDLPALTYYLNLYNCSNITGAYTAVSGSSVPTFTYLDYTDMSATDMDSTLIAYAATSKNGGTFSANGMTRTTASDTAVSTLTDPARGWTITGISVV